MIVVVWGRSHNDETVSICFTDSLRQGRRRERGLAILKWRKLRSHISQGCSWTSFGGWVNAIIRIAIAERGRAKSSKQDFRTATSSALGVIGVDEK